MGRAPGPDAIERGLGSFEGKSVIGFKPRGARAASCFFRRAPSACQVQAGSNSTHNRAIVLHLIPWLYGGARAGLSSVPGVGAVPVRPVWGLPGLQLLPWGKEVGLHELSQLLLGQKPPRGGIHQLLELLQDHL